MKYENKIKISYYLDVIMLILLFAASILGCVLVMMIFRSDGALLRFAPVSCLPQFCFLLEAYDFLKTDHKTGKNISKVTKTVIVRIFVFMVVSVTAVDVCILIFGLFRGWF